MTAEEAEYVREERIAIMVEGGDLTEAQAVALLEPTADVTFVLDLETTGTGKGAVVIEFGLAVIVQGQIRHRLARLVRPLDPGALTTTSAGHAQRVHGITPRLVLKEGLPTEEAAGRLAAWCMSVAEKYGGKARVCCYNNSFDLGFMRADPWRLFERAPLLTEGPCILKRARQEVPDSPKHKLGILAKHLGLTHDGEAHRALADADLAARVLLALDGVRHA